MVRLTLKRSLREESCCKVDVMNGATGLRFFSRVATDLTLYARSPDRPEIALASASLPICGVSLARLFSRAVRSGGFLAFSATSMVQYSDFLERADFAFAFHNQPQRHGLHSPGR